jgi:hypothetical protein
MFLAETEVNKLLPNSFFVVLTFHNRLEGSCGREVEVIVVRPGDEAG